jgi:hypothetical protein
MDLTLGAIFKVIVAALATYTVLPVFLILRDYLIWKLIGVYILNDNLRSKLKQFVFLTSEWNIKYCKNATRTDKDGIEVYVIDGQPASKGEFDQYLADMDRVSKLINELDLFINRKSRFLNWMLKHYKQEGSNPIQAWKEKELERLNRAK